MWGRCMQQSSTSQVRWLLWGCASGAYLCCGHLACAACAADGLSTRLLLLAGVCRCCCCRCCCCVACSGVAARPTHFRQFVPASQLLLQAVACGQVDALTHMQYVLGCCAPVLGHRLLTGHALGKVPAAMLADVEQAPHRVRLPAHSMCCCTLILFPGSVGSIVGLAGGPGGQRVGR
jgi:hypothetical protein